MGGAGVESVDGVTSIGDARAHDQDVLRSLVGQRTQGGRDHGGGVAPQDMGSIDIPGVPRVARHSVGREAERVVVVCQGNNSGATGQAHLAAPGRSEGGRREVDEQLDGMTARSRIGEVADGEVTGQLVGQEDGGHSCFLR